MGFGDSVNALLGTYSNCLKLLKAFGSTKGDGDSLSGDVLLRKSIKADRAKVQRAYSSRRSQAGRRFEKGDGPARSSLRRVLKKLTAAIINLLNISKTQNPILDYESLMSLSNASRIDAIAAFDQLSYRLGSTPSRSSVTSSLSSSPKHRRHRSSSSHSNSSTGTSNDSSKPRRSDSTPKGHKHTQELEVALGNDTRRKSTSHDSSSRSHSRAQSGSSRTAVANRVSLASISTDSTKLGEIPERKWRRRHDYDTGSEEYYNVPPTYPLKLYKPPETKERRFWGFFRR